MKVMVVGGGGRDHAIIKKLKENNVEVVLDVQREMFHVYPLYGMFVPEGRKSFFDTMTFIKNKFAGK